MILTRLVLAALDAGNQTSTEIWEYCEAQGRPTTTKMVRRILWELVRTGRAVNAGQVRCGSGLQTLYRPAGACVSTVRVVSKQDASIQILLSRLAEHPVMRVSDLMDGLDWHKDYKSLLLEKMWIHGLIECWGESPSLVGWVTLSARSPATEILRAIKPYQEHAA